MIPKLDLNILETFLLGKDRSRPRMRLIRLMLHYRMSCFRRVKRGIWMVREKLQGRKVEDRHKDDPIVSDVLCVILIQGIKSSS